MTIRFSELRSPQIAEAAAAGAAPVLPVGQTEEHGAHLPVNTDALIARHIAEQAVARLNGSPPAYALEPVCYGYSQKVLQSWPGTFVLPQRLVIETLKSILVSLVGMGFRKIVMLSCHGNHTGVTRVATREVADETGVGVGLFFPVATIGDVLAEHGKAGPGGSCHGGEAETSVMLHLAPELVDMSHVSSGDRITNLCPYPSNQAFVSTWTRQKSESGAYGDPTTATAELGKALFDKAVDETAKFIAWYHRLEQV